MIVATVKVDDVPRFLEIFSTTGAEKRQQHGSEGSTVFRDPTEPDRVWAVFDWNADGWAEFLTDPDVPAIFQEAGLNARPQAVEPIGQFDS